jgi:hypothetical protein
MKRYVLSVLLMSVFACPVVFAQEPGPQDVENQMRLLKMQLELKNHEAELGFQQEMRQLELEKQRIELEQQRRMMGHLAPGTHGHKPGLGLFFLGCFVVHILAAVWVYKDIRARECGSGIWIAIALLAGLCGALVYAVVRLGDSGKKRSE